jgi:hypothetical protein
LEEDQQKQICRGLGYSLLRQDEQSPDRRVAVEALLKSSLSQLVERYLRSLPISKPKKQIYFLEISRVRERSSEFGSKKFSWGWSSHSVLD